jgi:uncharacterized protein (TIGR02594 family)
MRQLFSFRRPLRFIALALCSASIFVIVSPASARPNHGSGRHAGAYHAGHHAKHYKHFKHRHHRHAFRQSRWERGPGDDQARWHTEANPTFMGSSGPMMPPGAFAVPEISSRADRAGRRARLRHASRWERTTAQIQARGLGAANASVSQVASADPNATVTSTGGAMASGYGSSGLVSEARKYIGGNPTGRGSLWCARFMNMVLHHSGYRGTGSDMASSFARYGQRISGPQVGAIAVMTRGRRGGHVGIITGVDAKGNPIMISGNSGNRVREAPVSRGRIYAYVMPTN